MATEFILARVLGQVPIRALCQGQRWKLGLDLRTDLAKWLVRVPGLKPRLLVSRPVLCAHGDCPRAPGWVTSG